MPTYQYACRACGHSFEVVQAMSDEPMRECTRCGGELRKVYAPPAIAFRGSGFYATDHGKQATKAPPGEGSGAPKDAGSGEGGPTKGARETKGPRDAQAPASSKSSGDRSDDSGGDRA